MRELVRLHCNRVDANWFDVVIWFETQENDTASLELHSATLNGPKHGDVDIRNHVSKVLGAKLWKKLRRFAAYRRGNGFVLYIWNPSYRFEFIEDRTTVEFEHTATGIIRNYDHLKKTFDVHVESFVEEGEVLVEHYTIRKLFREFTMSGRSCQAVTLKYLPPK